VKNLTNQVKESDLASLFIGFQGDQSDPIVFKLLKGKMKGQAFVTFQGEITDNCKFLVMLLSH